METPAMGVLTSPVVLRYSEGAVILGSNVSTCVGPPDNQTQITEARFRIKSAKVKVPRPSDPTLMKSRRVVPSQSLERRFEVKLNMGNYLLVRRVTQMSLVNCYPQLVLKQLVVGLSTSLHKPPASLEFASGFLY